MAPRNNGEGDRWTEGDMTYTVNPTDDPAAGEGGFYLSQQDTEGNKASAVYNEDYTFADTKANNQWDDVS